MRTCRMVRLGAARAPSPDVRLGPRGLGSLGCRRRFAIVAALGGLRRLPGHGQPLAAFVPEEAEVFLCHMATVSYGSHLILALESQEGESRPAVRPRADHAGHGVLERFAPRLTALGFYKWPREHQV